MKYSTTDINQAAFLWCQEQISFVGTAKKGSRVLFEFESEAMSEGDLHSLLLDYSNERSSVEPKQFCEKQTSLRGWLSNALSRG